MLRRSMSAALRRVDHGRVLPGLAARGLASAAGPGPAPPAPGSSSTAPKKNLISISEFTPRRNVPSPGVRIPRIFLHSAGGRAPGSALSGTLIPGAKIALDERSAHQITRVLRFRQNELVDLFDGADGFDYRARLLPKEEFPSVELARRIAEMPFIDDTGKVQRKKFHTRVRAQKGRPRDTYVEVLNRRLPRSQEIPTRIHAALVLSPRLDNVEPFIQRAVEMGAASIIPLLPLAEGKRPDWVDPAQRELLTQERLLSWRLAAAKAAEAAGRSVVPPVVMSTGPDGQHLMPFFFGDWTTAVSRAVRNARASAGPGPGPGSGPPGPAPQLTAKVSTCSADLLRHLPDVANALEEHDRQFRSDSEDEAGGPGRLAVPQPAVVPAGMTYESVANLSEYYYEGLDYSDPGTWIQSPKGPVNPTTALPIGDYDDAIALTDAHRFLVRQVDWPLRDSLALTSPPAGACLLCYDPLDTQEQPSLLPLLSAGLRAGGDLAEAGGRPGRRGRGAPAGRRHAGASRLEQEAPPAQVDESRPGEARRGRGRRSPPRPGGAAVAGHESAPESDVAEAAPTEGASGQARRGRARRAAPAAEVPGSDFDSGPDSDGERPPSDLGHGHHEEEEEDISYDALTGDTAGALDLASEQEVRDVFFLLGADIGISAVERAHLNRLATDRDACVPWARGHFGPRLLRPESALGTLATLAHSLAGNFD
ncbi:hypothetical protein H696_05778 [Fonticula alba]|uniref:16S rRNA (uracil(1498)-N(3))-methyltransferase n=1 Tax=Fonticula alba TaxID=691883 RepID=A0A058Z149_FONAL|nr:hypothetical protein H696_05778 [Fonticula alba]KCV67668.1 hypothetical protein H696_05778 [Fonticula alba]|eukprot:XP_009497852.1 hypothetical protein H696_05778 [Fonticula alba]